MEHEEGFVQNFNNISQPAESDLVASEDVSEDTSGISEENTGESEEETQPEQEEDTSSGDDTQTGSPGQDQEQETGAGGPPSSPDPLPTYIETVPEELAGSLNDLVSYLKQKDDLNASSTWNEDATQWLVTFKSRTMTVYLSIDENVADQGHYLSASDGCYVASGNLPLYEEYLYYMTGSVSASGVRTYDDDGGYSGDFVECSDGAYVYADDQALYEDWLLTSSSETEEQERLEEYNEAVLECLSRLERLETLDDTVYGIGFSLSENSLLYQESLSGNSLYHDGMLEAVDGLHRSVDINVAVGITGCILTGVVAGLELVKIFWGKMNAG